MTGVQTCALPISFEKALENVKPHLEVKARRVGGATYQVPMEVRPERQVALALRWLIKSSKSKREWTTVLTAANT